MNYLINAIDPPRDLRAKPLGIVHMIRMKPFQLPTLAPPAIPTYLPTLAGTSTSPGVMIRVCL